MGERPDQAPDCEDVHARLVAGEPTASADLFGCHAASLTRQLTARFPTTDPDLIHDAIVTALLDVAEHPDRYDPGRRSFGGYLHMVAHGDLLNLLEKQRRRRAHETDDDPVELADRGRNILTGGIDPVATRVLDQDAVAALTEQAMSVARTEEEQIVMRLMLDGERATEAFAAALGMDALSTATQQAHVFRVKDRLAQRLRRRRSTDV